MTVNDIIYAAMLLSWGAAAGALVALHFHPCERRNRRNTVVTVTIEGTNMPNIVEGAVDKLKVVAKNSTGRVILPLPDGSVVASVATDKVSTVDLTTGDFTFTAGAVDGPDNLVATVSTIASAAFVETVVADNKVASVEIQPGP